MVKKIEIDGVIGKASGQISAKWLSDQLPANGTEPIEIYIHSEGGSVWEGFKMFDVIKAYAGPKTAIIRSTAFSIASFIPMACDRIEITPNGYLMLHSPSTVADGTANEIIEQATLLTQTVQNMISAYASRTGKSREEITSLLAKDTYLDARQCIAMGFADAIVGDPYVGRQFGDTNQLPHGVVVALFGAAAGGKPLATESEKPMSATQLIAASIQDIRAAFPKAKADFVLRCLEQQMPMEKVAVEAANESMSEIDSLMAKIAELQAEIDALKAASATAQTMPPTAQNGSALPETGTPTARKTGVDPVAKGHAAQLTAKARWYDAVQAKIRGGMPREKAAIAVDEESPGLRASMLKELSA